MSEKLALKVTGLDAHYKDFQALWDVSMDVPEGKVVSVIGANGSGKSTLLNSISGLRIPSRGTSRPTPRLISSCRSGLRVLNGLNCFGIVVRKASTKRLTVVASQMVVARGMTTSNPAIRSFLRSC